MPLVSRVHKRGGPLALVPVPAVVLTHVPAVCLGVVIDGLLPAVVLSISRPPVDFVLLHIVAVELAQAAAPHDEARGGGVGDGASSAGVRTSLSLTIGFFMESGIGCSHSQSHL